MMESESGNIDWEGRDEKMFFEKKKRYMTMEDRSKGFRRYVCA